MGFYSGKMMEVILLFPPVFCPLGAEFLLGAVAASAGAAPAAGRAVPQPGHGSRRHKGHPEGWSILALISQCEMFLP